MVNDNSPGKERPGKLTASDEIFGDTTHIKGSSPVKYGTKSKVGGVYKSPGGYSTRAPVTPRKRARSVSDDDDDSISSPLSSLPATPSTKYSFSPTKQAKPGIPRSLSSAGTGSVASFLEETWQMDALGDYVWVLVDQRGRPFQPSHSESKTDLLWWPAKVTSNSEGSINVTPYGDLTISVSTIRVKNPSSENILPLTNSLGRPRFDFPSFVTPESINSLQASPRKKQKRERESLTASWHNAVSEMLREKEEELDDGLPPIEFALSASSRFAEASTAIPRSSAESNGKETKKGKGKASALNDDLDTLNGDRWTPPPPDMALAIPGELVLARERADKNSLHWPARILEYIPPPRAKLKVRQKEGKYRIEFLDDTKRDVPREWFYGCHQDGFGTCEMGQFESEYIDNPDEDEQDAGRPNTPSRHSSFAVGAHTRSPSPIAPSQHPSHSSFTDLSIREQFAYTKPVLRAILNEEYKPARERHDKFIKGGGARESLTATAGLRGKMDPRTVSMVQDYLSNWCLRDEIRGRKIVLEDECVGKGGQIGSDALAAEISLQANGFECVEVREQGVFKDAAPEEPLKVPSISSPKPTVIENIPSSPAPIPPTSSAPTSSTAESDTGDRKIEPSVEAPTEERAMSESISRQKGCEAYEALVGVEKLAYCLNVLLPEAILQMLLWRKGLRTSTQLLSDAEEDALHKEGQKLVEETDWVFDVVRLRNIKEKQVRDLKKAEQVQGSNNSLSRRSSRSRRNATDRRR